MDTLDDYNAWKAKQQENSVGAAGVVLGSVNEAPDEVAGDLNLANDFGKTTGNPVPPLPLVKEYRNVFQQAIEREKTKTVLSTAPKLTEWLRNPENSAVAKDDLQNLSWFEGFGRGAVATLHRAGERIDQMGNQYMLEQTAGRASDRNMSFGEILNSERDTFKDGSGEEHQTFINLGDLAGASMRYIDARYADLIGTDDKAAAEQYAAGVAAAQDRLAEIPKSSIATAFEKTALVKGAGLAESLQNFGSAFLANPLGGLSWAVETAGESAPQIIAAIGATAATKNPTAGLGVLGGGSYLTERYAAPADFLKEKGIDLGKPEDVQRLLSDPKILEDAARRGVVRGAIIGAFDMVSGGIAGRALANNPFVEALAQSVQQAILGSFGEYSARVAAGQDIDWSDILAEGFAEIATAPVDMGIAGRKFSVERRKSADAEGRKAMFEGMSGQSTASALRNRMPDKFRQFVESATANGPVENVFVPANDFVQYFQGIGVDPHALVDTLDGVTRDDLDAAMAGGGDLKIPTATYAAKIAGSEHDAFLMENMRFDPDQFTAREAAEFNAKAQDAMDEALQVAEDLRLHEESLRSHEQQIYDTMVSRLRAAGRSTDVATTEAMLYPAFYRTMAERSNLTVDEFMEKYPLPQVEGERPESLQTRDVDALNRTLAEARARRSVGLDNKTPLLEFISDYGGINDPGGELRARDASVIKRKGKKSLKLRRSSVKDGMSTLFGRGDGKKHGVDDVALAAIEAGFLADDPVVQEYQNAQREGREVPDIGPTLLNAIDRELRGEAQHSAATAPDPDAVANEAALDQIEAYLSRLGVNLDDSDEAIRAAVQADQDAEGRKYGQSGDVRGARGAIQFPQAGVGNGDTVIRLFQSADLSTMLHESGHYFLTVMQDLAARGEPNADADFAAVKSWWRDNAGDVAKDGMRVMPDVELTDADVIAALDGGTTGDVLKDAAIDVGMQEQWARAFEGYLMEGKAPSIELRGAFEKFRAWLISVYKRLAGLNVNVSDDIRSVFDRMIASDDEIAKAQDQAGGAAPLFATAEQMGLTQEEFDRFMKLRSQSEDDAKAKLLREALAPIKRERDKAFKEEKAKVREEVEGNISRDPVYRAIEWMGNRRWYGGPKPENMPDIRLSKDVLVDRYGDGVLKTLPRGMQTVYAVEGGLDPDDAAGWFGFGSGDELVQAMERAPKRKDAVDAETDRLMRERHGDVLTDGTAEAQALDAVHSDKRGQWIAAELKAVSDVAGVAVSLTAKEARAAARQTLNRMRVRDAMASNRFLSAERKAGEEAARLGAMLAREGVWMNNARRRIAVKARAAMRGDGTVDAAAAAVDDFNSRMETKTSTFTVADQTRVSSKGNEFTIPGGERTATRLGYNDIVAKLVDAKRRQLLNHALFSESRLVANEVEKAENYVARLNKKSSRERIAGAGRRENAQVDYLAAIDELLERYDFRRLSGAAEQRRGALNEFVEAMKAAGRENEIAIPDTVLSQAARAPYKTLPVEELRGVIDSLKNLEHMAKRWDKLIDAQKERELNAVVEEIGAAFDANVKKRPPSRVGTKREALRNSARQFLDLVLNAGTILREIDGFADMGAAYRNIKGPIDEAMGRLIVRKEKAANDLEALYAVYSKDERRRMAVRDHLPALGYALSKWERIAVALNVGNAGNRQRLSDPKVRGSLTEDQIAAVLGTLDAKDADFVQSVWDYVGSFRDDIGAREKRATGVEPQWVEATPVEIGGKTLRGGYYPIKYDPRLSSLARDDEAQDIAQSLQAGRFGKAQTKNGHLKERAQSSGRDVELDMSVLHRHVNQVVYDLELSEAVSNSWRVLQDGRIRSAFMDAGKQADFDALEIWLKDVAEGELRSSDFVGRGARMLKSNFTAAKLAFNLSTVAVQVSGLSQSMVVVGKKDFARGVSHAFRRGTLADIAAKSKFMASRQTTFNKDIYDFYSDPKTGPVASRWGEIKSEVIGPLAFWLMTKVQYYAVDVPTWMAGYHQGLRKFGNDEAKAIAHADSVVGRAQASGLFSDRSAVERGSVSRTARQNDVVRLFTALGSYMFAKFNVAYERTRTAGRVIGDEGLSVRSAQEALSWSLDMSFLFTLEAVMTAAIKGRLPGGDDDEDDDGWLKFLAKETGFSVMSTIPGVRDVASPLQGFDGGGSYGAITKEIATPFIQAGQGDIDGPLIKSIINATGLATGLPSTQINRAVDAGLRQSSGEDVSPLEYLLGRRK